MKKHFLFITSFCLTATITYSMDPNLSTNDPYTFKWQLTPLSPRSKSLLTQRAKENVLPHLGNCHPDNVTVILKDFALLKDQFEKTDNPRYVFTLLGYREDHTLENNVLTPYLRQTEVSALCHQKALENLGINLPK